MKTTCPPAGGAHTCSASISTRATAANFHPTRRSKRSLRLSKSPFRLVSTCGPVKSTAPPRGRKRNTFGLTQKLWKEIKMPRIFSPTLRKIKTRQQQTIFNTVKLDIWPSTDQSMVSVNHWKAALCRPITCPVLPEDPPTSPNCSQWVVSQMDAWHKTKKELRSAKSQLAATIISLDGDDDDQLLLTN